MPSELRNAADSAELLIYDTIGETWLGEGVTPKLVKQQLDEADGKPLTVRINSPGGDVFDGLSIFNLLAERQGGTSVVIDGYAASIASVIAMAAPTRRIAKNGFVMIHNPYTFAMGDSREMRRVAELLDSVRTQLVAAYEEATGQQQQSLSDWMDAETWFDSAQAKDHGFATEIGGKSAAAACLRPPVAFRNPPAALIFDDRPPPRLKPHRQYAALRLAKFRYGNN